MYYTRIKIGNQSGVQNGHLLPINSSGSPLHRLLPMLRFGLAGLSILWACIMQR